MEIKDMRIKIIKRKKNMEDIRNIDKLKNKLNSHILDYLPIRNVNVDLEIFIKIVV
jgi:hypothetical protein